MSTKIIFGARKEVSNHNKNHPQNFTFKLKFGFLVACQKYSGWLKFSQCAWRKWVCGTDRFATTWSAPPPPATLRMRRPERGWAAMEAGCQTATTRTSTLRSTWRSLVTSQGWRLKVDLMPCCTSRASGSCTPQTVSRGTCTESLALRRSFPIMFNVFTMKSVFVSL